MHAIEFRDGPAPRVVAANSAATSLHGAIQFVLMLLLRGQGWNAFPEVTLKLVEDAQPVPDIIADPGRIEQPYPTKPVALCIEIKSPADSLKSIIRKSQYYLAWGIPPSGSPIRSRAPPGRSQHSIQTEFAIDLNASLAAESLTIPLAEVFAEADRMLSN